MKEKIYANKVSLYIEGEELEQLKKEVRVEYDMQTASDEDLMDFIEQINVADLDIYINYLNRKTNGIIKISEDGDIVFLGNNLNDIFNNIDEYNSVYWWYDEDDVYCTDENQNIIQTYVFREIKNLKDKEKILQAKNLTLKEIERYTKSITSYVKKAYGLKEE